MDKPEKNITIPKGWENNIGAKEFFNKCSKYASSTEHLIDMTKISPYFISIAFLIIGFTIVVNIWLFTYYKSYIFKRQCRRYYASLMVGSLMVLIDGCLLEMNFENYPCFAHHLLTGMGYPLYLASIGLIIIKYYKYYYKSQIAYFKSFLQFLDDKYNEILHKKFIFKRYYTKISTDQIFKILMIYIFCNGLYSVFIYYFDDHVSSRGFCTMGYSYAPQIAEFALFLVLFLPLVTMEAFKFDDKFKMKHVIILTLILNVIYFSGFFIFSLVNKIKCSRFIQYVPPAAFELLSSLTSTIFLTLSMLNDIIYLDKCSKKMKGTYKGMLEMLEDKIFFREFGEFCRNENCVENILFFQEYWKYKKLFNKSEKYISLVNSESLKVQEISDISPLLSPKLGSEQSGSRFGLNEHLSESNYKNLYSTVEKEAEKFCNNFVGNKAIYEINIQSFITTEIFEKLDQLKKNDNQTVEEKLNEYNTLFDKAYNEVTNNIYLNSYSNYIHQKTKEQLEKEKNKNYAKLHDMC